MTHISIIYLSYMCRTCDNIYDTYMCRGELLRLRPEYSTNSRMNSLTHIYTAVG